MQRTLPFSKIPVRTLCAPAGVVVCGRRARALRGV